MYTRHAKHTHTHTRAHVQQLQIKVKKKKLESINFKMAFTSLKIRSVWFKSERLGKEEVREKQISSTFALFLRFDW